MKLIYASALTIILLFPSLAMPETLRIITKENTVRKENRFFSPVLFYVRYGDALEGIGKEGDWHKIRFKGKEGWVHKTAVTARKVKLKDVKTADKARHDEVALAGKGFNPEVEGSYKEKHPEAAYHLVDKIEAKKISDEELESFIKEGRLKAEK